MLVSSSFSGERIRLAVNFVSRTEENPRGTAPSHCLRCIQDCYILAIIPDKHHENEKIRRLLHSQLKCYVHLFVYYKVYYFHLEITFSVKIFKLCKTSE